MPKMVKQLDLLDYTGAKSLDEIIQILNENNRRIQKAYLNILNDVNHKEWLYFTVGMRRWRIGPKVGYNPGRNKQEKIDFVIQEFNGTDPKNHSHWGEEADAAETTIHGGELNPA
jgi:hypothetical protein